MSFNKKRIISIFFIVLIVIIFLTVYYENHRIDNEEKIYNEIKLYVNDNYELLESFPYSKIEEINSSKDSYETKKQKEEEIIKNYLGKNTIVKNVYAYNENILQFYCVGEGFLDTGTYTGFYFSKEDTPFTFEFGDSVALVEISPGIFEGQDEDGVQQKHGGHKIYTEKIRDKWYYYKQYLYYCNKCSFLPILVPLNIQ